MNFKFLDLIRSFSAIWVLVAHCIIWGGGLNHIFLLDPKIAVDIFMILSGFLLTNSIYNVKKPYVNFNETIGFYTKRFFRIAPLYYIILFFTFCFNKYFIGGYSILNNKYHILDQIYSDFSFKSLLIHLSFCFGLFQKYSFSTMLPDWSLSLEMQFYFILPLIFYLFFKFGEINTILFLTFIFYCIGLLITKSITLGEPSVLFLKFQYFAAGILMYFILLGNYYKVKKNLCLILALFLVLIEFRLEYGFQKYILGVTIIAFYYLGNLEIKSKNNAIIDFCSSTIVSWLSKLSYSIYLVHGFFISSWGFIEYKFVFLDELQIQFKVFLMVIYVFFSTLICSYILYQLIEVRFIKIGKDFFFEKKL